MKALLVSLMLVMSIGLVGCDTMPKRDQPVLIKYKYIINTIPADMLDIPAPITPVDSKIADDLAVGNWMIDSEKRVLEIEGKLKSVKKLQDQRLEDAKKLPKDDVIIK